MKWIGKHPVFSDLLIGGVLLTPPDNQYSYELTLPDDDGTSGQVLTTDGNGVLTWVTNSAGGTGVSMTNGVDNRVMTATAAQAISGEANLTFDGAKLDVAGGGTSTWIAGVSSSTLNTGYGFYADLNDSLTATHNNIGLYIDYDKSGVTASSQTATLQGVKVDINDAATNNASAIVLMKGISNCLTAGSAVGDPVRQYGIHNDLDGGDEQYGVLNELTGATASTTIGIQNTITDGGLDLKFRSSADVNDYFSIATGASAATTITTVDGGAAEADLTFTVDGNAIFNTNGGVFCEGDTVNSSTFHVSNTADDAVGGTLVLGNSRGGTDGEDDDVVGAISFLGKDDGTPSDQIYGYIQTKIADATSGQEAGQLELKVAEYDGTISCGLKLDGDTDADGEIDVTIGAGAASLTTIAGDLDIDGDNMTSAGEMTFTPVGKYTIVAPDINGTVFHLDADADTDNVVNIDAGRLDIDSSENTTITAAGSALLGATGTAEVAGSTVTLDSAANIELEVGATTNYINAGGIYRGGNIGPISDTFIPIMPSEFMMSDSYRYPGQMLQLALGKEMNPAHVGVYYVVQKMIPNGYTASSATMYGTDGGGTAAAFICYENTIAGATPAAVSVSFAFGTQAFIGGRNIVGDGLKFCTIVFDPGHLDNRIYGGLITIAKT